MAFVRTVSVGQRKYRQLVESYWDPKTRTTRKRILRHLDPVAPRFPRADPTLLPPTLPMEPVHFGLLATRMMRGTLTAAHVVQTVQEMGEEMPPGALQAVDIRFDLAEKNSSSSSGSSRPPPTRVLSRLPSGPRTPRDPRPPRSSRSKGRAD